MIISSKLVTWSFPSVYGLRSCLRFSGTATSILSQTSTQRLDSRTESFPTTTSNNGHTSPTGNKTKTLLGSQMRLLSSLRSQPIFPYLRPSYFRAYSTKSTDQHNESQSTRTEQLANQEKLSQKNKQSTTQTTAGTHQSANHGKGTSNPSTNQTEPKENIYTIPNYLTVGRFFVSPFLGYIVLQEQFAIACGLFMLTGLTDLLDGYIARNWEGQASILGSVIDPLADKFLVTILAVTLTAVHLIPVWLTALVLARDVYLVFSGFRVRWVTLPPPKTFKRYFDFSHPTASVQPSFISKVNTNVQLLLLTATCAAPVFGYVDHIALQTLWGVTAVTTTWSFISYLAKAPYTPLEKD